VIRILFILCCSVTLLGACEQTQRDDAIHFAIAQAPINLDPRYATDAASERVNRLLYQRLVEFDASAKPMPSLGSWETLNDKLYRVVLKSDIAAFHHEKQLTAADVKATYDSLIQLNNSPHAAEYANIQVIRVINPHTLEFV